MIAIKFPKQTFVYIGLLLLLFVMGCSSHTPLLKAQQGEIDLSNWNFQQDGVVKLSGEWDFYWQKLTPSALNASEKTSITVPSSWNDLFPSEGYGTYHLKLTGLQEGQQYGIKVPYTASAFDLWINEQKLLSGGTTGVSQRTTHPSSKAEEVYFKATDTSMDLYVTISNFHHRDSGMVSSFKLGEAKQVLHLSKKLLAFEAILFGSLVLAGLYHFVLYFHRKKEKKVLLFGIACLIISTRVIVIGEQIIVEFFPNIPWEIAVKIEYLTFFTVVPLFTWFIQLLYPREVSRRFTTTLSIVSAPFILTVLITRAIIFTHLLYAYQLVTIITLIYLVYALTRALINKREGSAIVFGCASFYALTVINDILFTNHVIDTLNLAGLGLFVFIFSQSYIIARSLSAAFGQVEDYSSELAELNRTLENRIMERTMSLEQSKLALQKANDKLQKLSYYDQLTQIPNRRYFDEVFDQYWAESKESHESLAFLYLDIDHFKLYNDQYGHQKGDQTLYQIANQLEKVFLSHGGFVARMGGEEFVAIVKNKTLDTVITIANECRQSIHDMYIPHEKSYTSEYVTISIGGTYHTHDTTTTPFQLIQAADDALYKIKETGRNQCLILPFEKMNEAVPD